MCNVTVVCIHGVVAVDISYGVLLHFTKYVVWLFFLKTLFKYLFSLAKS